LILTSNLGSQFLVDPLLTREAKEDAVLSLVRSTFNSKYKCGLKEFKEYKI